VKNTAVLTLVLLMLTTAPPVAMGDSRFTNAIVHGEYKCALTAYTLPPNANQPFAAASTADITVAADGKGTFTAGTWDHTIDAPGAHMECKLIMSKGTYSINSDGTGAENTKWQLLNDSSPGCSTYFPDTPAGTAQLIVTNPEGRTFYTSSLSRFAILAVACQKYVGAEPGLGPSSKIDGAWFGLLRSPNYRSLRLGLHVRSTDKLNVAFDDIDRANMRVPCENAKFNGSDFSFEIPAWHAKYTAALESDGKTLSGFWDQWKKLPLYFVHQPSKANELAAGKTIPAARPVSLNGLKAMLDREFAPVLDHGLLAKTSGGGVVIGVLDHGQRRIFSYGAARPDSIFEIGSITKTFTGLALAQMVEQKRVTLDEPLGELLPADVIPKSEPGEITLLDLATHHSGLPRLPDNLSASDSNAFADYDILKVKEFFGKHAPVEKFDPQFQYSNFGFGVLGYALARRAGSSYERLIKTEITGPLGLNDTVVSLSPQQKARLMQGYNSALDPTEAGAWDYPLFEGAGSLKSTAADMLGYLNANLHPDELPTGTPAVSPAATLPSAIALDHVLRADAWKDAKVAMDWVYDEKLQNFGHGGGTTSYSSWVQFSPQRDRALVVLYNRLDDTPGQERFVDRVAENVDELMSGKPSRPIDCYPDSEGALVAAAARSISDGRR
jgi:serine-type D-Ala-D-Ala carboxypeptidase/endopeptidase